MDYDRDTIKQLSTQLIELAKCSITNTIPEFYNSINLRDLVVFSKFHNMENLICEPLEKVISDQEFLNVIKDIFYSNILFDTQQIYYFSKISKKFEESKIRFLPLKGCVMKYIYPDTYKRKCADIDIYIYDDIEAADKVMKDMGFKRDEFEHEVHYSYSIDNISVELHYNIIDAKYKWSAECIRILDRTQLSSGFKYKYEMVNEDYYFYMIAHMAKHMRSGGAGIRFVLDVWVYLSKYNSKLDWGKLNIILKRAHLYEFNNHVIKLTNLWFNGDGEPNDVIEKMALYIQSNGWIGTYKSSQQTKVLARSKKEIQSNKIKNIADIIFPSLNIMKSNYHVLERIPVLLPLFWCVRWIKTVLSRRDLIKIHSKSLDINAEEVIDIQNFFDNIGL